MHYTTLAQLALESVRPQLEQQKKYVQSASIGVFDGLGSIIYLLMHLSILRNKSALLQEAEALAELLPALIAKDDRLDIISGSAGCILNLLSLYAVHPSPQILMIVLQCGDRLLATAQTMHEGVAWVAVKHEKPLGVFSHGTAGIALSLLKLAAISGEDRYRQGAIAALTYDRSLFLPDQQNWADLRTWPSLLANARREREVTSQSQANQACMVGWCHGAAGVGLSRLAALDYLDDAMIRKEIDIAFQTTLLGD